MLEERRFSSLYAVFYSAFSILSNQRGNVMHKRCRFRSLYGVFGIAALFAGSAITYGATLTITSPTATSHVGNDITITVNSVPDTAPTNSVEFKWIISADGTGFAGATNADKFNTGGGTSFDAYLGVNNPDTVGPFAIPFNARFTGPSTLDGGVTSIDGTCENFFVIAKADTGGGDVFFRPGAVYHRQPHSAKPPRAG
jgi:hypothetical protein